MTANGSPTAPGRLIEDLSWPEVAEAFRADRPVIVPIGAASKEHGHHLPMKTDWLLARTLAEVIAAKLPVLIAPIVPFGYYPPQSMFRGVLTSAAMLCLLAMGGCTAERTATTTSQASKPAASKEELTEGLGQKVGQISQGDTKNNIVVGPALTASLVRGISHTAHANGAATLAAREAFLGSGQSQRDMIRPSDRSLDKDKDYTELLYAYLATIDPGGTSVAAEFYEDDRGCETDLITRKGKDGVVRYYLVDSTGWQDTIYEEMGERPDRHCQR